MTQDKGPFGKADPEQEQQWRREARLQYDPTLVQESNQNWNSYTADQREAIKAEGNRIYSAIADAMQAGHAASSADVQVHLARWHQHLRYFYEPSLDLLQGLGQTYNSSPDFIATFQKIHADLPAFLEASITHYVDELETAAIEALLAADDDAQQRRDRLS